MKKFWDKYHIPLIAAVNVLAIYIFCVIGWSIRYETNDDALLSDIANGAFGSSSQNLIYVNIVFSYFLKGLYTLMPGFNHLILFQIGLVIISVWILYMLLSEKCGIVTGLTAANICFIPFAGELFCEFQYVKTSSVIILAGLALTARSFSGKKSTATVGIVLTVLGCFIRFDSFIAMGALSAFYLIYVFLKLDNNQKKRRRLTMAAMFAVVFGFQAVHIRYYSFSPEWARFSDYNDARTEMSDYKENYLPVFARTVMESTGLSENDIQMVYSRNFFDNTFFTTEKIQQINDAVPPKPVGDIMAQYGHVMVQMFKNINEQFYKIAFICALAAVVLCPVRKWPFTFGTIGIYLCLLAYLMVVNRYMQRIEVMLVLGLAVNMVLTVTPSKGEKKCAGPAAIALLGILLIAGNFKVQDLYFRTLQDRYIPASYSDQVITQISKDKDNLYLFDPLQTDIFAGYDVFHPRQENFFSNICPTGSWYSNSIFTNDVLERFDIQSPLKDSVNRTDVFISNENIDIKLKYVQEHFDPDVYAVKVTDNGLCDYQFRLD